jgi:cytochrome P450
VARRAAHALGEYFAPRIEAARGRTADDLVTLLANAELDGARLSVEEILPFLRLLSPAAFETTARALSNILCGLLGAPDQLAAVAADRRLVGAAVHEGLRWEPPLLGFARTATRDTELCGVRVAAGATVVPVVASANRDETRWAEPHRFDLARPMKPHLTFAQGPHTCLGMHLALLELEIALAIVLERLPGLRVAPGACVRVSGGAFRSALELPVVFAPGGVRHAAAA